MRTDVFARPHALPERSELYSQALVSDRPRHSRRQVRGKLSAVAAPGVSHELAGDKVAVGQVISQLSKDSQHSYAESVSGLHSGL